MSSGLLPRVVDSVDTQTGNFVDINTQTLNCSTSAYIGALTAGVFDVNQININNIYANPNLSITVGNSSSPNVVVDELYTTINNVRCSTINDITGGSTVQVNGDVCTNASNTQTLTNKTIDSLNNIIKVDGTDINDLIDQSVKQTADVSFQTVTSVGTTTSGGNLTSQGTLIVTGPKISPLPTSPMLSAGLDTLGNPRLQFWGDPANVIGSLTFGNISGTSQYEGKLEYDGVTNTFSFYTSGSSTPIMNITPASVSIGGSTIATAANSLTLSNKVIDSSANTIQISNSPLSATNINTLINQPLLTSSAVNFSNITATQTNPFVSITDLSRNGLLGISSVANAWFSGAATGDFCISNRTNGAIRLGQGTGAQPANFILTTSSCSIVQPTTVPRLTQSGYSAVCRYNLTANALVTNVVTTGVFVNIVTSIALASIPLQNFNTNGNVGVTYTGSLSRRFLISYSVTITTSANIGHSLQCTINGVSVPQSVKSGHSHTGATAPSTTSCTWISLLAPNDQLQLQLANLTNTTDLLAERITFTLNELDF